ncbi:hypothetical protein glysoja_031631 [Glycine soja]|uniref:Uncharacterized protein n=1 Tax=Glycine soja TaxID=3848 RepID=A0A0B2PF75_GLYSO|nr:hypothetical protein glysoja_031631 [Glycine soja]
MNPLPFQSPPPWFPILPSEPPNSTSFWDNRNVCDRLRELQNTLNLAKAMQKELEMLMMIKDGKGSSEDLKHASNEPCLSGFVKCLEDKRVSVESQESLAVEAANSLTSKLRAQLEPFRYVADEASPCFGFKSELLERHSVHDIKSGANCHYVFFTVLCVLKMKAIAKSKAKEEEKKVEAGVTFFLVQITGHFLPEEDDKFLEKVQAAVEEEEREALAAVETDAAKDAIATAEESRKAIQNQGKLSKRGNDDSEVKESKEQIVHSVTEEGSGAVDEKKSSKIGQISDPLANLPIEFYHYYHGSNNDMGTLIEVRRGWNAYIRPGGSRIPGHWVQPLPPANEIWASYLVRPK